MNKINTPKKLGYRFPAEWEKHRATWLSWPHNKNSWPGKIDKIYTSYCQFIKIIAEDELVCINVNNKTLQLKAIEYLDAQNVNLSNIQFFTHPTNDTWCRDHGPSFLINPTADNKKIVVNWNYNAWGEKYPPYNLDNSIPELIGKTLHLPIYNPDIVMEGGSVDFNGQGSVLTTKSCLLNPNRNPQLNQSNIEEYLQEYYSVDNILWLNNGIAGDDTDGHIDDITRFVNKNTIVTAIEHNKSDLNYNILKENADLLSKMKIETGENINVVEIPMPSPIIHKGQRLPASYANFYICNNAVIVPTFRDNNDGKTLDILQNLFLDRKVIGIDSTDIIWGLGSFHCLSQQEPQ